MKRHTWWSTLLVLSFALAPAIAGDVGDAPKKKPRVRKKKPKAKHGLRGHYAQIVSICKLSDEETQKFKEALQPYFDAQKANKERLAELSKQAKEAREAKDKAKMKEIGAERKKLTSEMNALRDKAMDVLTPDQKTLWEGYLLYRSAMGRYKKVGLDESQQNKIRELCDAKAKEMVEAKDEKAKRAIRNALGKEVFDTVLTAEQQEKAKKPRAKKPREKKAPGEKKRKKAGKGKDV